MPDGHHVLFKYGLDAGPKGGNTLIRDSHPLDDAKFAEELGTFNIGGHGLERSEKGHAHYWPGGGENSGQYTGRDG